MRRMSIAPPNRLVQICKESSDFCTIDCPNVTSGGFLTARGFPTGYFYTTQSELLTVYRHGDTLSSSREIFKHNFGAGTMVAHVSYFRLNEESDDAFLVLVRQAKTGSSSDITYIYCISMKTKKPIKNCVLNGKFNRLEVCIDGSELNELDKMKDGLKSMPNIVVVGGEDTTALLLSLGTLVNHNNEVKPVPPFKKIALLRPDDNGEMEFRSENGGTSHFDPSSARVQSLCYMSQRASIAIGLSNGIIYFISMKTGRSDSVYLGGSIERIVVQHPLNDTDNSLFLWAQIQHRETSHLVLMSTLPNDANQQNELLFIPRFSYVPPGCVEFLQLRTVVLSRQQAAALGNSDEAFDEEGSRDSNTSFAIRESGRFNQLMLFLYVERVNNSFFLKGSVFDLDGYYSRRMPREVSADRTSAQQCGFLSHFRTSELSFGPTETLDFMLADVGRFVPPGSLGTLDQHFYPSSLYFTFQLLSDQKAVEMRVPCLQDQVVNEISKNFIEYYAAPVGIVQFLHGVGLCNSLADENSSVMRTCLLRVLLHNYFPGCMNFLHNKDIDEEILHFVHKWLGKEVEITKSRLDEESKALFTMKPSDLPRPAILFSEHSQLVFRRAAQLYDVLMDRFQKLNINDDVIQRLKINKKICEDLLLQISAMLFGSHIDLLRETPQNMERLNKLRIGFAERRAIASRLNIQLEIYKIFEDIIAASRGLEHYHDLFGKSVPHELYPPETFTDLLDVLPHFSVTLSAKLQIFGYFCKDLDLFAPVEGQKQSTFDMACGFLLNDKLNSDAISEMMTAWNSDMRLLRINQMRNIPGMDALKRLSDVVEKPYSESDLKFMPCTTKEERDNLLKLYERFPHGIHKFNLEMISRRRFELIVDPPAQQPNEPDEVKRARNEVARIKRDFAHLFVRNTFDQSILNKCREQQSRPPHMTVEPSNDAPLQIKVDRSNLHNAIDKTKRKDISDDSIVILDDNEDIQRFEAFPPRTPVSNAFGSRSTNGSSMFGVEHSVSTPPSHLNRFNDLLPKLTPPVQRTASNLMSTPINKNGTANGNASTAVPPSPYISQDASKLIRESGIKSKELERLNRLTTPQSVRIRHEKRTFVFRSCVTSRKRRANEDDVLHTPPTTSSQTKAPTSILRDHSNKRVRIEERSIKFTEKSRVLIIPSNHENRELQQAETSFTDFAALNESSVDEGSLLSLLSRASDNIEMEEQLNAPNFDDETPDLPAVNGEDNPNELSSGSQSDQTPSPIEASPIKQVRRTRETAPEPETRKEASPVKAPSPVKDTSPVKVVIKEPTPVKESSPVKEPSPVKEKSPVKASSPIKEKSPVKAVTEETPTKRGRKRKSETPVPVEPTQSSSAHEVPEEEEVEKEAPVKTPSPEKTTPAIVITEETPPKRGRQRKSETPVPVEPTQSSSIRNKSPEQKSASPVKSQDVSTEETTTKRGRPKKSDVPTPVEPAVQETESQETPSKRRGRPRKSDAPTPVATPSKRSQRLSVRSVTPAESGVELATQETESQGTPSKRRGRPKKSDVPTPVATPSKRSQRAARRDTTPAEPEQRTESRASSTKASPPKLTKLTAASTEETPSKRRGRPKKSETSTPAKKATPIKKVTPIKKSTPAKAQPVAGPSKTTPAKRGRPKKSETATPVKTPTKRAQRSSAQEASPKPEGDEDVWLRRHLRATPERKRRTTRATRAADKTQD